MTWILIGLTVVIVFAIAAALIGRESHRLDALAPRAVYVLETATAYVADRLSPRAQAELTPGELEQLLVAHLNRLHAKGLLPANVTDRRQDLDQPLILDEIDETAYLLGVMDELGVAVTDVTVAEATATHLSYLDEIGAVGPAADGTA